VFLYITVRSVFALCKCSLQVQMFTKWRQLCVDLQYVNQSEQSVRAGFQCSLWLQKLALVKMPGGVNTCARTWHWIYGANFCSMWHGSLELVNLVIRTIAVCTIAAVQPTLHSSIGDRSFPAAATHTCNSLPQSVTASQSLQTFRKRLKTELFQGSYMTSSFPWLSFL